MEIVEVLLAPFIVAIAVALFVLRPRRCPHGVEPQLKHKCRACAAGRVREFLNK